MWMYKNYLNRVGCILADDMGLGKTVQVRSCLQFLLGISVPWGPIQGQAAKAGHHRSASNPPGLLAGRDPEMDSRASY